MRLLNLLRPRGGEPLSALVGGIRHVRARARGSAGRLGGLAAASMGRHATEPLPTTSTDPADRFRVACSHYDADPATVQDRTHRATLLYAAIAAAVLALDVATWRSYASGWFAIVGHVSPLLPALALAFQAAFGNWQVRRGRLDGLGTFLRSPAAWWPAPATAGGARGTPVAVLLAGIVGSVAIIGTAPPAHAADTASTSPDTATSLFSALPTTDLWGHLLTFAFPGVGPVGGTTTPISAGIADSFAAVLALLMGAAAAVLAGQTVVACVESAHSGQVLGRWHRAWTPLRVVYGFASLAPIAKGYCLLQVLVVWVAVASGQLGDRMWSSFVAGLIGPTLSAPAFAETTPLVRSLLSTEVCFAEEEQISASYGTPAPTWPATYTSGSTAGTIASGSWSWVSSWWSGSPRDTSPITLEKLIWDYGACGQASAVSSPDAAGGLGTLNTAQAAAFDGLRTSLRAAAKAIVATTQAGPAGQAASTLSDTFAEVVRAKATYDEALSNANSVFVSSAGAASFSDFQSAATSAGWVTAGPYYMSIARISSSAADATAALPTVDATSYASNRVRGPLKDALYGGDNSVMGTVDDWWDRSIAAPSAGGLSSSAASAGTLRQGGAVGALRSALSSDSWLEKHVLSAASLDPSKYDGIQQLVDFGDYTIGIGEALVGVDFLVKIAPYFAGPEAAIGKKATEGGGGLTWDQLAVGSIGVAILAAGIYAALILPMMPCLHFLFAVIGILIVVIEGVCAAPLWALAHCRMDGESAIEPAQRAGYTVLMQVFCRIPLTLLGLFFSLLVFDAAVWLLSVTLAPAMAAATVESTFGVVSTIVYLILTAVLSYAAANRSFSLITALPDGVLRWLGAGGDAAAEGGHAGQAVALIQRITGSPPRLPGGGKMPGKPGEGGEPEKPAATGAAGSVRPLPAG